MYTVYVLKSLKFDKIYVGFTSNPELRLISHNHPQNKGWTRRFMPWKIVYSETFSTKHEAMDREKQLKSYQGRKFIRETILKDNL